MSGVLYIYGLVRAPGLPAGELGAGVGGGPVWILPAGGLMALVSRVPPGPVAQTRRNMIAHTSVLERAIARTDVLPLRFGTVAPGESAFARCIGANEDRFATALDAIAGRVELGLKASWCNGVVFGEIIAADAELGRLRDRLRTRATTETYYERVELGRRVEAALGERRKTETAAILADLSPLAEREMELRTLDENMIFNRAFLVRRENEIAFDRLVHAAGDRAGERIGFRYVGPVPPYNFVDLQVNWITEAAA